MHLSNTNTVHVIAPPESDVEATHLVFERFGEVASVAALPDDASRVSVSFFDVRSAERAVQALGASYCTPGPQSGMRTVFLPADAQFNDQDFSGISDCQYDAANGCYIIGFFDIRDAARYQTEVAWKEVADAGDDTTPMPPGLEPPPGLVEQAPGANAPGWYEPEGDVGLIMPPGLEAAPVGPPPGLPPPPGLEDLAAKDPHYASEVASTATSEEPVCRVIVTGMPNKLLTDLMMEAVLQQAGLDSCVTGFSLKPGKPVGEAIISFSSRMAAEHCMTHFSGCQWDQSGKGVSARVISSGQEKPAAKASKKPAAGLSAKATAWEPWQMDGQAPVLAFEQSRPDTAISLLSADTPEFQPMLQAQPFPSSTTLSAKAPEFVPGKQPQAMNDVEAVPTPGVLEPRGVSSDTSTEVGESEDEKGTPRMLLANWQRAQGTTKPGPTSVCTSFS
mmetsp:Transcript_48579/g.125218  ORF Transcript_48579/g.125218 Transcript_48579/m.125218 type:complete len:447 (-) Transcript_48579:517-1857(-)